MQAISSTTRLAARAAVLLTATLLAACGSSSTSSNASSKTTGGAAAKRTGGAPTGRFTALRECLAKQGVVLPGRVPGKAGQGPPPPGNAAPFGGQRRPPEGVSRSKLEAAMKKCASIRRAPGGLTGRLRSPAYSKALAKFATCMRRNGVAVPTPDTSGDGPVFSTKGLDTSSAKFRAAQQKCASLLSVARPGVQGAPAPPAAG
jgi:hypothetical protein